jgi:hypothetical protein
MFDDIKDWISEFTSDNRVLSTPWFYVFYICLMLGVWVLPSKLGMVDYTLFEKVFYSIVFLVVDYFVVSRFID